MTDWEKIDLQGEVCRCKIEYYKILIKLWETERENRELRAAVKDYEVRFNPWHDEKGRFASAPVNFSGKLLDKFKKGGIMNIGSDNVAIEYQRYGRNKDTIINKTYINSGEYRKKIR
ncbi:MAG: hypothetical protein NC078_12210 [Ruminococcus sp.]|nr:hypothetical protein [Ruminococcus sp.]